MKRIMHIDIDSFFASVEMVRHKYDENIPLLVTNRTDTGIVSSANYAARAYGIKSAMNISKAKNLCPHVICIKSDIDYYREVSDKFFKFLNFYLRKDIEIFSVDECFIDVTTLLEKFNFNEKLFIADLKYNIKKEFGLNTSIGISSNKYTAKLLSDNAKPNGFLSNNSVDLMKVKITNLLYINQEKLEQLLKNNIIHVYEFFDEKNEVITRNILGNIFDKIKYSFFSNNDVIEGNLNRPNSLSNAHDFIGVENNIELIESVLIKLLNELVLDLEQYNFKYQVISIYYRVDKKISRISAQIDYTKSWRKNLLDLFHNKWKNFNVNYIGVTLSNVIDVQEVLFDF